MTSAVFLVVVELANLYVREKVIAKSLQMNDRLLRVWIVDKLFCHSIEQAERQRRFDVTLIVQPCFC